MPLKVYINFLLYVICFVSTSIVNLTSADILVNKLDDIEASVTPGRQNNLVIRERLCIGSSPPGPFSLIVIGSGANGDFTIQSGPHSIPYLVSIRDRITGGGFRPITPGIPLTGLQSRALNPNNRCRGNASILRVIFNSSAFVSAPAGIYRGTIQISVIPE